MRESLRLDQDVVVGDGPSRAENLDGAGDDLLVPGGVAIEEGEERGGIDKRRGCDR
jgi:hypothetical protein